MPGKKHAVAKRKTSDRTKGEKKPGVTPQPKPVKRESAPPRDSYYDREFREYRTIS